MDKAYKYQDYEKKIYADWQKADAFDPDQNMGKGEKSFSIVMPPPNANDPLHVGHAMFVALEDSLIRFHRMRGDDTVWIPGTDHAGIETQFVFEKKLKKEGKSRFQFDRETLYQMIWDYVQENSGIAIQQMKELGASADWSRYKFTLDLDIIKSVLETFQQLDKDALLYRDNRLVNYCPKCGTAFSNLEIEHQEQKTKLYYLQYGPFVLATTRPETKFADIALAVHPDDQRYQKYIGEEVEVDGLLGKFKLKVIADQFVDPEFGTGVVKVTPYHDFNDFAAWQRHQDELPEPKQVINFQGKLTEVAGKYAGMKVLAAREQIVRDLQEKGLLVKVDENYQNNLAVCYRCKNAIEPLPLPQFYIRVKSLTKPILEKLKAGEIKVYGAGYDKILRHWLEKLDDWNISRQIAWGIRIPVYYKIEKNPNLEIHFINKNGENIRGKIIDLAKKYSLKEISTGLQQLQAPIDAQYEIYLDHPGDDYLQETDTFDTWFSSSQWPFVALQNNKKGDFERFYPNSVMETGYDILPFWVMRMLMMGFYRTKKLPFKDIYLHGLIRDAHGRKMSKSKGNVISPMEISQKYGTDALRMAIIIRSTAGLDKSVGDGDFKAMRNLTNKLWNASRFILLNQEAAENTANEIASKNVTVSKEEDQLFIEKLEKLERVISQNMQDMKLGLAAETLHNEFWHWFCDQTIEKSKNNLINQDVLLNGLLSFLKMFHPFMPFVTEAIWQEFRAKNLLPRDESPLLMQSHWPRINKS